MASTHGSAGGTTSVGKERPSSTFRERTMAELFRILVILLVRFEAVAGPLHGLYVAFGIGAGGEGKDEGEADEHHCASFVSTERSQLLGSDDAREAPGGRGLDTQLGLVG